MPPAKVSALAGKNRIYQTALWGAGAYRHFIPTAVKSVISREEFVTAYFHNNPFTLKEKLVSP